jgi:hypothetical protein
MKEGRRWMEDKRSCMQQSVEKALEWMLMCVWKVWAKMLVLH